MNQPSAAIELAITIRLRPVAKPLSRATDVVLGQLLVIAEFANVLQLARLMADLSQERGHAQSRNDGVLAHGGVEAGNKNAGFAAGVREDL